MTINIQPPGGLPTPATAEQLAATRSSLGVPYFLGEKTAAEIDILNAGIASASITLPPGTMLTLKATGSPTHGMPYFLMGFGVAASFRTLQAGAVVTAPTNSSVPTITGVAQVNVLLTATTGVWANNPTAYSYQWKRGGVDISGATGSTYTVVNGDLGQTISVLVSASNTAGSASAVSASTSAVIAAAVTPPANTVLPVITGTAQEGQVLAVSNGSWTGSPVSYARQWKRNGADIAGATAANYTAVLADVGSVLSCMVTATNSGGSVGATSAPTASVIAATVAVPVNTALPAIIGTAQVGQTLSVSNGAWTNSPTGYAYQWLRSGAAISAATASTYVLVTGDLGATISCAVTATNASGSTPATSSATSAVVAAPAAPVNSVLPAITGIAQVGQVLAASTGTWSGSPTGYAYQWKRGGASISGATSANYTAVTGDIGAALTVTVTATNGVGSTPATSAATAAVVAALAAPVNSVLPAITGTVEVGNTLTTSNGTWSASPTGYTYAWRRGGVAISGATANTYALAVADLGALITCAVTATNAIGSNTATSAATAAVVAPSKARFGTGSATAGVSTPAALLASMTIFGATNASKAGNFTVAAGGAGVYGWAAFESGASAAGVQFQDALGTGGWQGASSAGNNSADPGVNPNTSTVTFTDANGAVWRFFRLNYANAGGTFTTS